MLVSSESQASPFPSAPKPTQRRQRVAAHSAVGERPALTATAQAVLPGTRTTPPRDIRVAATVSGVVGQVSVATTTPHLRVAQAAAATAATAGAAENHNLVLGSDGYEK